MWNLIMLDGYFEGPQPWDLDRHNDVWGEELERLSLEQLAGAAPVVLGAGTPLFGRGMPRRRLDPLEARPLGSGAVLLRYAPAAAQPPAPAPEG